jgi:hypothetical protein
MEEDLRVRFKEVLSFYKSNINQLSKGDKAMQVRLSRQINNGATITFETVSNILDTFPDVSAEWLLRGKGEMLIASSPNEKKEEEALAESLFRNVLVEFMSMVNKRLKSIDNNTQSSVDKLEGITDLLAELRKTA